MNLLAQLAKLFAKRPLAYGQLDAERSAKILDSRHQVRRFTLTQLHSSGETLAVPTLALVQFHDDMSESSVYVGVLANSQASSTLDTRLTFLNLRALSFPSLAQLAKLGLPKRHQTYFRSVQKKGALVSALPPQMGMALMDLVVQEDEELVRAALHDLPEYVPLDDVEWERKDANKLAQSIFGLSGSDRLDDRAAEDQNVGAKLFEDRVIDFDANTVPGYDLIRRHITGRSEFRKDGQVLHIFNANRGVLEHALGVDLIYVNETLGNTVMVQYKMLEQPEDDEDGEWTFRVNEQLREEMERMRLPRLQDESPDYRMECDPFFFKFVKRKLEQTTLKSFIISLGHLNKVLVDPRAAGPRRGVKISYTALGGSYLREADLIGLIRSGYVGTHALETKRLRPFLEGFLRGDRALVLAWQAEIKRK